MRILHNELNPIDYSEGQAMIVSPSILAADVLNLESAAARMIAGGADV